MKLRSIMLLSFIFLLSCTDENSSTDLSGDKILEVESNLIPPVYIEGDATWTIEERMNHYGVPGVSIAVINEGKIAWAKTYGIMDKETKTPVTENTLFQAASISKPVSAYAALRLVEQGEIDLNANINSQLKSLDINPKNDNAITQIEKIKERE